MGKINKYLHKYWLTSLKMFPPSVGGLWADHPHYLCYLLAVTLTHPLLPDASSAARGVEKVPNPMGVVTTTRIIVTVFMVSSDPWGEPARSFWSHTIVGTLKNFTVKIK